MELDNKIKVVIKNVGEAPRVEMIEDSLYSMQKIVDGYIETVPVGNNVIMVCNEEGKYLGLQTNFVLEYEGGRADSIKGNVFFVSHEGADFKSLEEGDINELIRNLTCKN